MKVETLETLDDLSNWLKSFPQNNEEDRRELHYLIMALAQRSSMRVLPHFWSWGWSDAGRELSNNALVGLRCAIISQAALIDPKRKLDKVAKPAFINAKSLFDQMGRSAEASLQSLIGGLGSADSSSMDNAINSTCTAAYMNFALGENDEVQCDAENIANGNEALSFPLWYGDALPKATAGERWRDIKANRDSVGSNWDFWIEWYDNSLHGYSQDWGLLRKVAWINPDDWEKGADHINGLISRMRRDHLSEGTPELITSKAEKPISKEEAQAVAQRLIANRDAIVLSASGLLEQIANFREVVRGKNQIDPKTKEDFLSFLDELAAKLQNLISLIPASEIDEDTGRKGVRWMRDFSDTFFREARKFADPKNVAEAVIPTSIILGCTGLGALVGSPMGGTIVGGLLTGQLKPGQAADQLLKPKKAETSLES